MTKSKNNLSEIISNIISKIEKNENKKIELSAKYI